MIKYLLAAACIVYCVNSNAQGGGPPMLTDDPAPVDFHKWEINTSINSSVTNNVQLATPYIDANYGIAHNVQLKAEAPYLLTFAHNQPVSGELGDVILGIKYWFADQEKKHFLSASIYPQLTVTNNDKGFFLPLLLEKTCGKLMIGEEVGYFTGENNNHAIINGNLVGYIVTDKFQVMGEYFMQKNFSPLGEVEGFINYGFRYTINENFILMGSFGTQIITPINEQRQYFISFLGLQSDF